ncbi:MAG: DUF2922 domain-containing protein [Romboutsia sp.]
MEITKKLLMQFKTVGDKKVSISVDNPKENLTESQIKTAMESILEKDIFAPNGEGLASLVGARIVETDTKAYDLVL